MQVGVARQGHRGHLAAPPDRHGDDVQPGLLGESTAGGVDVGKGDGLGGERAGAPVGGGQAVRGAGAARVADRPRPGGLRAARGGDEEGEGVAPAPHPDRLAGGAHVVGLARRAARPGQACALNGQRAPRRPPGGRQVGGGERVPLSVEVGPGGPRVVTDRPVVEEPFQGRRSLLPAVGGPGRGDRRGRRQECQYTGRSPDAWAHAGPLPFADDHVGDDDRACDTGTVTRRQMCHEPKEASGARQ